MRPQSDAWFERSADLIEHLRGLRSSDHPPPRVAGYRDLVFLERGGQGAVFLAERTRDARRVALKVFHQDSFSTPAVRRRFEREIQLVSRLNHPNIVRLYQWGSTAEGQPFLSMEFVEGVSLEESLRDKAPGAVVETFLEICDAIGHAHRRGVIHRDLKPSNVRVDSQGHVRVLDFGLAKPVDESREASDTALTGSGQFLGTLQWASPEQLGGRSEDVDTRADVYALGLLLYRALTGRHPYPLEGGVAAIIKQIEECVPEPPSRLAESVGRDLDTVVLRCLAKDAQRRYSSVDDLARDLRHIQVGEPIEARRDGLVYHLVRVARRHPWPTTASVAGVLLLGVSTVISSVQYRSARRSQAVTVLALEAQRAESERFALTNEFLIGAFLGPPGAAGPPTVEDAIDRAAPRIEAAPGLVDRPDVRADINTAFAFWYGALPGRLEAAEAHALDALVLHESLSPPNAQGRAAALEALGGVRMRQGRYPEAAQALRDGIDQYRLAGADELNVARLESRLAACAVASQEFEGLLPYLEECYDINRRRMGEQHPQTQGVLTALRALRARSL